MPVVCPGCGRSIDLPSHELSLPSITCARCDTVFVPSTGQLLAPAVPDDSPAEYASPPPPLRRGALFAVGGAIALTLLLILVVIASRPSKERPSRNELDKERKEEGRPAETKEKYPYPECAACVRWLKENMGDPASLEIISWEERKQERHGKPVYNEHRVFQGYDKAGHQDDYILLMVKYRLRNVLGGTHVERRRFIFKNGRLNDSFDMDGRPSPGAVLHH